MRAKHLKQALPLFAIWRRDVLRLTSATAGLLAALVAVFFAGSYTLRSYSASSAAKAALSAQARTTAQADAQARRVGTIVLASDRGACEELHFDNFTGAFISIADVDCETTLAATVPAVSTPRDNGAGMRGMLDSFKK